MVFGRSSNSFIIGISLGIGGYRSSFRPGPPAHGDPSGPRCSAPFDQKGFKEILDNVMSGPTAKVLERYCRARSELDLKWIGGIQRFGRSLLYKAHLISPILFVAFFSLVQA